MLTMQAFYNSLKTKPAASASSKAHRRNLLRITRASRTQLLNLKSDLDWTIWSENKASATAQ